MNDLEFIPARIFGHDIPKLVILIKSLFHEFNKGDYADLYSSFSNALHEQREINWQDERYNDPKQLNDNEYWKRNCCKLIEILDKFENILLKKRSYK